MKNANTVRLLGFRDFFKEKPDNKLSYAMKVGKDNIQRLCCLMLTYCKEGHTPTVKEIIEMWFTYNNKSPNQSVGYVTIDKAYNELVFRSGHDSFYLLCEESLLNLYIWATENQEIPENIEDDDGSFMVPLFMLFLTFNDTVLENYQKSYDSAERHLTQKNMRRIFADRFSQNDLIKIDYGKLIFTQMYKLMQLLNFMEANNEYQLLFKKLLEDFDVTSKEDFFKAIGGAVINPLNPKKTGINYLVIEESKQFEKSKLFLDKLAFEHEDVNVDHTDFKFLRDKPFQKLPDQYRVVFDLFLIKKLYNGLIFKLSSYATHNKNLFPKSFFGSIRDVFSEGVLLYNSMEKIMNRNEVVNIKGTEFKENGINREPDYYSRLNDKIALFESKDFFMKAEEKQSYDFDIIVAGLKDVDGRLGKAVKQLTTNVGRVLKKSLLDTGYDANSIIIYPIVVVHDSLYNTYGLNYWVDQWFQENLDNLKKERDFNGIDFLNVRPVTIVDMDALILYQTNFEKGELDLFDVVELYQQHANFAAVGESMDEKFFNSIAPFADFIRYYAEDERILIDLKLIREVYAASGYIDI